MVWICSLPLILEIFSHYPFKYLFYPSLYLFYFCNSDCKSIRSFDLVLQFLDAMFCFIFYFFFSLLSVQIFSRSSILFLALLSLLMRLSITILISITVVFISGIFIWFFFLQFPSLCWNYSSKWVMSNFSIKDFDIFFIVILNPLFDNSNVCVLCFWFCWLFCLLALWSSFPCLFCTSHLKCFFFFFFFIEKIEKKKLGRAPWPSGSSCSLPLLSLYHEGCFFRTLPIVLVSTHWNPWRAEPVSVVNSSFIWRL